MLTCHTAGQIPKSQLGVLGFISILWHLLKMMCILSQDPVICQQKTTGLRSGEQFSVQLGASYKNFLTLLFLQSVKGWSLSRRSKKPLLIMTTCEFLSLQIYNNTHQLWILFFSPGRRHLNLTADPPRISLYCGVNFLPSIVESLFVMAISATLCTQIVPFPFFFYGWKKDEL